MALDASINSASAVANEDLYAALRSMLLKINVSDAYLKPNPEGTHARELRPPPFAPPAALQMSVMLFGTVL